MKVWRGFTLTIWVSLLIASTILFLVYQILHDTALDKNKAKQWLADSSVYSTYRDTVLAPQITKLIEGVVPSDTLIDKGLVTTTLKETLPKQELATLMGSAVNNSYAWLDSKEPTITATIPLNEKKEAFYTNLEKNVAVKIKQLPICPVGTYTSIDTILSDGCLPRLLPVSQATSALMTLVRGVELPLKEVAFELPVSNAAGTPKVSEVPTYLNYLWLLHKMALLVIIIVLVLLIATRRAVGVIASGVAILLGGLVVALSGLFVQKSSLSENESLGNALVAAFLPHILDTVKLYGLYTVLSGVLFIGLGVVWIVLNRRRRAA